MSLYHSYFLATSLYRGWELEIILSSKASLEGGSSDFFQVPALICAEELGILPSPKASIEGAKPRA